MRMKMMEMMMKMIVIVFEEIPLTRKISRTVVEDKEEEEDNDNDEDDGRRRSLSRGSSFRFRDCFGETGMDGTGR